VADGLVGVGVAEAQRAGAQVDRAQLAVGGGVDDEELVGRTQLGDRVFHDLLLGVGLGGAFESDDVVQRRFHVDHHRGAVDGHVELELAVHVGVLLLGLGGEERGCREERGCDGETGGASESDLFHGSAPCRVGSPGVLLHSLQLPA